MQPVREVANDRVRERIDQERDEDRNARPFARETENLIVVVEKEIAEAIVLDAVGDRSDAVTKAEGG
jgi:hypothetical protein